MKVGRKGFGKGENPPVFDYDHTSMNRLVRRIEYHGSGQRQILWGQSRRQEEQGQGRESELQHPCAVSHPCLPKATGR